jgi:hypothetical protein
MRLKTVLIPSFGTWTLAAVLGACGGSPGERTGSNGSALGGGGETDGGGASGDATEPPPVSDSGRGTDTGTDSGGPGCTATLSGVGTVSCDKSILVTESDTLSHFSLEAVLDKVVSTSKDSSLTALGLYQQLLDTLNDTKNGVTKGPHCDTSDPKNPNINGFAIECPRQEGILAKSNPFTQGKVDSMFPVGVSNRFDLAPANGANCGQYRVLFAKNSGLTDAFNRFFIIFEAVLPNPSFVDDGKPHLDGCKDVAQFWADLSKDTPTKRGTELQSFYFTGLKGFDPVIQASNYGFGNGGGTNTGQIRSNMFMFDTGGQEWELREFRLSQTCTDATECTVIAKNSFAQNNPFGALFGSGQKLSSALQTEFLTQVSALAGAPRGSDAFAVVNSISMTTPDEFNAGESDEQDSTNIYADQDETKAFLSKITSKLETIDRTDLTATDILNRATTQSCAGCHEVAVGDALGPKAGDVWPATNIGGFVQVTEQSTLSPALTSFFTPNRLQILVNFLGTGAGSAATAEQTVSGAQTGSAN